MADSLDLERDKRHLDQDKLRRWLETKGKRGAPMRCPICEHATWGFVPFVFRALQKPYSSSDFVEVSCGNCGFMMRLDTEVADLGFRRGDHGD